MRRGSGWMGANPDNTDTRADGYSPLRGDGGVRRWRLVSPSSASLFIAVHVAWLSYAVVPGNVDVTYLIVVCNRLLDGARLYVDVIETNPPFSVWLYMPVALGERLTGVPAELLLSLGIPVFALASVALCARILGSVERFSAPRFAWLAPVTVAAVLYLFPGNFGQREQIGIIALLPWLALLIARHETPDFRSGSTLTRILAGIGAAVFVMIKPPFAVLALALPAFGLCFMRRSLRPLLTVETLLGAVITLAYLAVLALFYRAFFTDLMPMLAELYLPARKSILHGDLVRPVAGLLIIVGIAFAVARPGRIDRAAALLLLAALGYVPCYLWMGKGWDYQAMPIHMFGLLALCAQLWTLPPYRQWASTTRLAAAAGAFVVIGLVVSGAGQGILEASQKAELGRARDAVVSHVERPTVASIATRMQAAFPLTRMIEGRYQSRYASLWAVENAETMIATADSADVGRLEKLRDRHIADAARELQQFRPDVVLAGGARETAGQTAISASPAIQDALENYRVIYRNSAATIWLRSDLAASSAAAAD